MWRREANSYNIVITYRRLRWAEHATRMGEDRNTLDIIAGNLQEEDFQKVLGIDEWTI